MRILLICPFKDKDAEREMFLAPPFGIYRLRGFLKKHGIEVDVLDPNTEDVYFERFSYDIIGFSMYHLTLENDLSLIHKAKQFAPQSVLVGGGIEATFDPEQIFENSPVDIIVLGEGERPLLEMAKAKRKRKIYDTYKHISGLIIREDGELYRTGFNSPLSKTEFTEVSLSFDFDDVPYEKYWNITRKLYRVPNEQEIRTIRIFTGNYCPHNCAFCSSTHFLDKAAGLSGSKRSRIVQLSPEGTIKMIKKALYAQPTAKTIMFDDDNFMLRIHHVEDVCQKIIEGKGRRGLPRDLSFICQARVNDVQGASAPLVLKKMANAGFRMIMYGVESFSQRILDNLNKKSTPDLTWRAIDNTLNARIQPLIYLILMPPTTELPDLISTMKAAVKCIKMGCQVSTVLYLWYVPGASIVKETGIPIDWRIAKISDTKITFTKADRVLPISISIREIVGRLDATLPQYENYFCQKFNLQHLPARTRTLILFYALADIIGGLEKLKFEIEDVMIKRSR